MILDLLPDARSNRLVCSCGYPQDEARGRREVFEAGGAHALARLVMAGGSGLGISLSIPDFITLPQALERLVCADFRKQFC